MVKFDLAEFITQLAVKVGGRRTSRFGLVSVTSTHLTIEESDKIGGYTTGEGIVLLVPPEVNYDDLIFIFLHELYHIMFGHTKENTQNVMKRVLPIEWTDETKHEFINIAMDYRINYAIQDIFPYKLKNALFDSKYDGWSELDILRDLVKKNNPPPTKSLANKPVPGKGKGFQTDGETLADELDKSRAETGSNNISKELKRVTILDNPVDKIESNINTLTYQMTDKPVTSWSSLNNIYRPLRFPITQYQETYLSLMVAIDTSGSMSDKELNKIYSMLKDKEAAFDEVTYIYHHHEIYDVTDKQHDVIQETGGTSHKDVFNYIRSKADDKTIVLIFTDLWSDVENLKPLDQPTYFIVDQTQAPEYKPNWATTYYY